jgi:hypothetical protein
MTLTRLDTDLPSDGPHGHGDSINIKVSSSEMILALDAHDHLLGLGVVADQLLVQPNGQGQGVVDGAEGDGCDWAQWGDEVEDVLVGVEIPEGDDSTLTVGAQEGRLHSDEDGHDS